MRKWIEGHFSRLNGDEPKTVLEIGCFPGQYLSVFGELGYELHGIDRTPRVEADMPCHLKSLCFRMGQFSRNDFLASRFTRQYDVVASFGFIEHFTNWDVVLHKQASLVKSGGFIVVETPNFRGFVQRLLHRLLDRENLNRHNLEAMRIDGWKTLLAAEGFEICTCGYFGRVAFWVDHQKRTLVQRAFLVLVEHAVRFISRLPIRDSGAYSPFCGLVARRMVQSTDSERGGASCENPAHR